MLTKKQLLDAVKCDATCQNCSLIRVGEYKSDCIPEIAQTALAYRETLEQAEKVLKSITRCPYCWGVNTHSEKCEIQKIIEAITKLLESEG